MGLVPAMALCIFGEFLLHMWGILFATLSYFIMQQIDVVTLDEFKAMLGGIGETTARKILHENHIKYFFIRSTYRIPKVWVIEYVLSDHYAQYRQELKVQI